jgi:hypothetical protein
MAITPHAVEMALQIMEVWLDRPRHIFQADVYRFADRLPPEEVLEAVMIAQAKFPDGGLSGFYYFCGVCNRKIDNQRMRDQWNLPNP